MMMMKMTMVMMMMMINPQSRHLCLWKEQVHGQYCLCCSLDCGPWFETQEARHYLCETDDNSEEVRSEGRVIADL